MTDQFGNYCDYFGEPYINNCGVDGVGEMLTHLFRRPLAPRYLYLYFTDAGCLCTCTMLTRDHFASRVIPTPRVTRALPMTGTLTSPPDALGTWPLVTSMLLITVTCTLSRIFAHNGFISLWFLSLCVGCLQSAEEVNTTFVEHAGYNGWAEAVRILRFSFSSLSCTHTYSHSPFKH